MDPKIDMLINSVLALIFAVIKAQGLSEEQAKAEMEAKVSQIENLTPLPVDP
jgi:hypothetical protein